MFLFLLGGVFTAEFPVLGVGFQVVNVDATLILLSYLTLCMRWSFHVLVWG